MSDKKTEKEDKRAAALRANLKRRKIAQRGKAEAVKEQQEMKKES